MRSFSPPNPLIHSSTNRLHHGYFQPLPESPSRSAGRCVPVDAGSDLQADRDVVLRHLEVLAAEAALAAGPRAEFRVVSEVLLLSAVRPARRGRVRSDLRPGDDERDVLLPR